jgi:hypothetical protein
MPISIATIREALPVALAAAVLIVAGCSDATTREDVSDAREELREEQQDLAEERLEAQHEVADAREEAQKRTVAKPVVEDDAAEAQQDLAETRHEAAEDVADEREDVQAAATDLRTEQQRLQATQARDAYVKEAETRLATIAKSIEQLETRADKAEGADKKALDLRIAALQTQHDRAEEALETLKSADLATWENHKEQVRAAMQDAGNTGTVR